MKKKKSFPLEKCSMREVGEQYWIIEGSSPYHPDVML